MTSARTRRGVGWLACLALVGLRAASPAEAQSLAASQPLDFGQLLPGRPEVVTVDDAWRRAEVKMVTSGNVDIRLVVPTALTTPQGAQIPLTFRLGDGAVLYRNSRVATFDPNQSVRVRIPPGHGEASILVGGTATPSPSQPAGVYRATLVVVVTQTDA